MINTYEYETELSNPAFLPMFVPGFHHGANMDNFRQPYPLGTKLPEASAKNFIGQAYIAPITANRELNVPMSNVTFEPRCRNNWHYHKGGQILVASAGIGYYQEKGKPARRLYPGDIVEIAPDVFTGMGRLRIACLLTLP